jgi:hypothetical protein
VINPDRPTSSRQTVAILEKRGSAAASSDGRGATNTAVATRPPAHAAAPITCVSIAIMMGSCQTELTA